MKNTQELNDQIYLDWAQDLLNDTFDASKHISSPSNSVYELKNNRISYFLKIGSNLEAEYKRLVWLEDKTLSPHPISFKVFEDKEALLISGIEGFNLYYLSQFWDMDILIKRYAEAILNFHSIAIADCPFGVAHNHTVLTHGDACLPNLIFTREGEFKGFIDLGDMKIDDKEIDLAAAIWSLQFNLGAGYGQKFLSEYGIDNPSQEMVDRLWHLYNDWIPLKK